METIATIRQDYYVHGKGFRRIARERKVSRNTVRKAIGENKTQFGYQRSIQPLRKMGDYVEQLDQLLSDNLELPRKQRLTLKQMYEALCQSGFKGSYHTVCHHARKWRHEHACGQSNAFIPLQFAPGKAYQFDWSEEFVRIGSAPRKVRLAQMKLCYSRQPFVRAYPRETLEMVFDAHNRAFAWYGGSCERGIYDNMRTAVSKVKSGKERHYNRRFEQMCSHFLVRPQACTPASGWEKGRVEKQVLDLRRALLSGGELQFGSLDELNEHLQAGFVRYSRDTRHPEFRDKSAYEVFLEERSSLIPFVGDFDAWSARTATVTKTLLVNFDKNRYSVAARTKSRAVDVRAYSDQVVTLLDGEVVAEHDRSFAQGETIYDPMHNLPVLRRKPEALRNGAPFINWKLPAAIQQVHNRLQSFSDGDREMVSVLSAAEQLGFECLEQACREALEQGCCHADVILNHAHQLQQPAAAQSVSTPAHLRLRQPPKADCRRYDDLTGGKR